MCLCIGRRHVQCVLVDKRGRQRRLNNKYGVFGFSGFLGVGTVLVCSVVSRYNKEREKKEQQRNIHLGKENKSKRRSR